jgi:hypothetical protein
MRGRGAPTRADCSGDKTTVASSQGSLGAMGFGSRGSMTVSWSNGEGSVRLAGGRAVGAGCAGRCSAGTTSVFSFGPSFRSGVGVRRRPFTKMSVSSFGPAGRSGTSARRGVVSRGGVWRVGVWRGGCDAGCICAGAACGSGVRYRFRRSSNSDPTGGFEGRFLNSGRSKRPPVRLSLPAARGSRGPRPGTMLVPVGPVGLVEDGGAGSASGIGAAVPAGAVSRTGPWGLTPPAALAAPARDARANAVWVAPPNTAPANAARTTSSGSIVPVRHSCTPASTPPLITPLAPIDCASFDCTT